MQGRQNETDAMKTQSNVHVGVAVGGAVVGDAVNATTAHLLRVRRKETKLSSAAELVFTTGVLRLNFGLLTVSTVAYLTEELTKYATTIISDRVFPGQSPAPIWRLSIPSRNSFLHKVR